MVLIRVLVLLCKLLQKMDGLDSYVCVLQIVRYILDDTSCLLYSSDSDSESDDEFGFKFWTYIRH